VTTTATEREVTLGPTGTPAERFTSRNPDDFPHPHGREEEWRFTPVRDIRPLFEPFDPDARISGDVQAPDGVTWEITGTDDPRVGRVLQPADRISALAFRHAPQAFVLQVAAGRELDEPVFVHGKVEPGHAYEHMVIEAGANARATVVVDYTGHATVAENVEIVVGDGAHLTVVSVQDWDAGAQHVSAHQASVGRNATLRHIVVDLGGSLVRLSPAIRFAGRAGTPNCSA
jgi:ABC-type transport system involved in Fe-S cluster assembly, permease component